MKIKKRQKPLLPCLRQKKRYLAFEIISESKIGDFSAISSQIMDYSVFLMGEIEAAKAGITVMHDRWDQKSQKGIIKVGTKHLKHLSASLAMITDIQGRKAIARSIGVSGTLKKAGKYIAG